MLAEFALIIALEGHREYIGNFIDCAQAFQHALKNYKEYDHMCLHEDYVSFPTDQPKIYYYPKTKD